MAHLKSAHLKSLSFASLLALAVAMPAVAQQAPPADPDAAARKEPARDVVVVTANKREESVQDIAVAVTAVTSKQRDELGIQTVQDLTNFTPGLSYSTANERVTLRGIGRNTNNFGTEPGVANYIDGIYTSFATLGAREPLFVDRVEVVRGPQGTLYGRNSIGGALNVISKRPTDTFKAEVRAGVGNYDQRKLQALASGPITDSIRYLVAGSILEQNDGYYTNAAGGPSEGGGQKQQFLEAQLDGNFGETFDWWLKIENTHYNNRGAPGGRTSVGSPAPYYSPATPGAPGTFGALFKGGDLFPRNTYAYAPGIAHTQQGNQQTNPATSDLFTFNANTESHAELPQGKGYQYQGTWHAPSFDVKMLGGYVYYHYRLQNDGDGTPINSFTCGAISAVEVANGATCAAGTVVNPRVVSGYDEKRGFFSNEINVLSTGDGPFQWIGGVYAYQENYGQPSYATLPDVPNIETGAQNPFGNLVFANYSFAPGTIGVIPYAPNPQHYYFYDVNTGLANSYGLFGQIDWSFAPKFKLTLGARYSEDNKQMTETGRLLCYRTCFVPGMGDITRASWTGKYFDPLTGVEKAPPGVVSSTPTNLSGVTYDTATGLARREMKDKWDAVTGTAGLEFRPDTDTLTYLKYSRGYKAGGFGTASTFTSFTPLVETDKELVDSYELGIKREWSPIRLTTNVDLFYYDYKNAQTPLLVVPASGMSYTALVNIPKTETTGIEFETTWEPIENLRILLNYAYINAEIKKACCFLDGNDPSALQPGANIATTQYIDAFGSTTTPALATGVQYGQSLSGQQQPYSAKNKVALNVSYTWNFDLGSLSLSGSYFWRDKFYTSVFNRPTSLSPSYDQTDFRAIWTSPTSNYTIIGYVRNAFDQKGYDSDFRFLRAGSNTLENPNTPATELNAGIYDDIPTLTPPRTYGVELQYRF